MYNVCVYIYIYTVCIYIYIYIYIYVHYLDAEELAPRVLPPAPQRRADAPRSPARHTGGPNNNNNNNNNKKKK